MTQKHSTIQWQTNYKISHNTNQKRQFHDPYHAWHCQT